MVKLLCTLTALLITVVLAGPAFAEQSQEQSQEERNLIELRNTVANILQALVERGVLTREQAEAMVKAAQDKAAAEAAAATQQKKEHEKEEANAVRVPYVPQIVKDQISKEVAEQVTPQVTQQVISEAKTQGWGIPGALPDWIERTTWSGDVRVRGEADLFAASNAQNAYLNYNAVNAAGGIAKAGAAAFANTSIDREYPLVRLRLNMNSQLGSGWSVGARLSTGTLINPDSLNQTLGQYGGRYTTDVDLAYIEWSGGDAGKRQQLTFWGGKFENPYLYSDLIWMPDVTFEGLASDYRLRLLGSPQAPLAWFMTLGAYPQEDVPLTADYGPTSNNKWLYAGQTGLDFNWSDGSRARFGVAYYDYNHMAGQKNSLDSTLLNYTAPPYVQKGNTMFDISNDPTDPTVNLFALAADFRELDYMLSADVAVGSGYKLSFFADYVKNIGYNAAAVEARLGSYVPPRVQGYEGQLGFGSVRLDHAGAWRTFLGYRYVERDAVVDAFTDQDYHLGGTDAKGYILGTDVFFTDRVWGRLRYMPFSAIDGPPLTIDVWQLDLNANF
ncbi:MAG: putative porin [Steroidobacteraceae bacterium]